jgi:two-component system cell cycle sensor histidine kinase/response regulator CckA
MSQLSIEPGRSLYESARLHLARMRVEGGASLRLAFQEASRLAAETLDVERVSVWLFVEKRSAIRCFELYERTRGEHSEGSMLYRETYPTYFACLETQRAIAAEDARTHEATRDFRASYLEPLDIQSMLDAPIFQGGEVAGVVCHETVGHRRAWTPEDSAFAASVADAIALQVEAAARHDAETMLVAHEAYVFELSKMEALGRLAAGVAHDFRNILSVVLGHARLIEADGGATPRVKEQAQRICAAADRGVALTRELTAFGKEDAQEKPHAVRVPDVIEQFRDIMMQTAGRRTLTIVPATTPGWVLISPPRLERVLLNLVTNACDAMPPSGGTITITTTEKKIAGDKGPPGAYVVIEVRDDGRGMDEETRRHMFEPFFTTKRADANSGLGLSVVYRIVEASGGFLHVDSAPGKGTTVAVYLPRVASQG